MQEMPETQAWIGKNIGGTIGGPYEWRQDILDVKGFSSEKGEPLPNDDLDLQLIWLCAMEEIGPSQLTARELAEYWIAYIPPHWNEYGTGKANLKGGLLPPLCGEYKNEKWRHSNGAWIRSEIWACLAPGYPEVARRYAFADACIDHGMGEGTVAEQFTATMESLAFFNDDIRDVLNQALAAIPQESRVARSVRIAMDGYDAGKDWVTVRNELVKDSEDLGWFMAPANIGYVVIGLLYGEGDFKKSMLTAVNCGDDTDCTAATIGAFLGIRSGMAGIPSDWVEHIGDEIVTVSIDRSFENIRYMHTVTRLTERVMNLIPSVLTANNLPFRWTDGETELIPHRPPHSSGAMIDRYYDRQPLGRQQYAIDVANTPVMRVQVEFDKAPVIAVGETVTATVRFINKIYRPVNVDVRIVEAKGLEVDHRSSRCYCDNKFSKFDQQAVFTFTATEEMAPLNRVIVECLISDRHMPILFEIPICAK